MIGSLNLSQTQWARNVVQVSAAVCGEERCVTRQITAAWETIHGVNSGKQIPISSENVCDNKNFPHSTCNRDCPWNSYYFDIELFSHKLFW